MCSFYDKSHENLNEFRLRVNTTHSHLICWIDSILILSHLQPRTTYLHSCIIVIFPKTERKFETYSNSFTLKPISVYCVGIRKHNSVAWVKTLHQQSECEWIAVKRGWGEKEHVSDNVSDDCSYAMKRLQQTEFISTNSKYIVFAPLELINR